MTIKTTKWSHSRACLVATIAYFAFLSDPSVATGISSQVTTPVYDWSGFYVGADVGVALGTFKTDTSADPNGPYFENFFSPSDSAIVNQLGKQKFSPKGFTGGAEVGYNWQDANFVAGFSADFDFMRMNGSRVRSADYPSYIELYDEVVPFLQNSTGNADWLVTLRPRVGYADDTKLFYVTGGLALANPREDAIFADNFNVSESASRNSLQAGYALGAGMEWALSNQLTMKAEYLHVGFGSDSGHETSETNQYVSGQKFGHNFNFQSNLVRLGINYHFGENGSLSNNAQMTGLELPDWLLDWQAEIGLRLWVNAGRSGAPDPLLDHFDPLVAPKILASRIAFSGLDGIAGETYARFDNVNGFFVKGYLGAGGINSGHQNNEDFPYVYVYSNTRSTASGALGYATIDAGYSFFRSSTASFGAFVGYNHYTDDMTAFGCTQIAQGSYCEPAKKVPGLTQDDTYQSLRLGASSQFMPSESLRFTADIAYLPAMTFEGRDYHMFRQLLLGESASNGDGVMLDADLDYLLTDAWSVGIGGRYWAYNMRNGSLKFIFLGASQPNELDWGHYNSERYGIFFQTSYRLGVVERAKADVDEKPFAWTGIYAGVTLGAGISDQKWRDPYPSTSYCLENLDPCPSNDIVTNEAGFGDRDHASGPLAGVRLTGNWETDNNWVFGAEAEARWADIKGQGTCFSGLGGVNCGHTVNAVYDLAVRGGYAWDQMLVFVKAGNAWVGTKESIFGDSNASDYYGTSPAYGHGVVNDTQSGLLIGSGFEFAIEDKWTVNFEYNHVGGLASSPQFSTVNYIGDTRQHVSQSLNFIDVGLSYKLY